MKPALKAQLTALYNALKGYAPLQQPLAGLETLLKLHLGLQGDEQPDSIPDREVFAVFNGFRLKHAAQLPPVLKTQLIGILSSISRDQAEATESLPGSVPFDEPVTVAASLDLQEHKGPLASERGHAAALRDAEHKKPLTHPVAPASVAAAAAAEIEIAVHADGASISDLYGKVQRQLAVHSEDEILNKLARALSPSSRGTAREALIWLSDFYEQHDPEKFIPEIKNDIEQLLNLNSGILPPPLRVTFIDAEGEETPYEYSQALQARDVEFKVGNPTAVTITLSKRFFKDKTWVDSLEYLAGAIRHLSQRGHLKVSLIANPGDWKTRVPSTSDRCIDCFCYFAQACQADSVSLHEAQLSNQEVDAIQYLLIDHSVTRLDLSDNQLGDAAVSRIQQAIETRQSQVAGATNNSVSETKRELSLSQDGPVSETKAELSVVEAPSSQNSLGLTQEPARALTQVMEAIDLTGNPITPAGFKSLESLATAGAVALIEPKNEQLKLIEEARKAQAVDVIAPQNKRARGVKSPDQEQAQPAKPMPSLASRWGRWAFNVFIQPFYGVYIIAYRANKTIPVIGFFMFLPGVLLALACTIYDLCTRLPWNNRGFEPGEQCASNRFLDWGGFRKDVEPDDGLHEISPDQEAAASWFSLDAARLYKDAMGVENHTPAENEHDPKVEHLGKFFHQLLNFISGKLPTESSPQSKSPFWQQAPVETIRQKIGTLRANESLVIAAFMNKKGHESTVSDFLNFVLNYSDKKVDPSPSINARLTGTDDDTVGFKRQIEVFIRSPKYKEKVELPDITQSEAQVLHHS